MSKQGFINHNLYQRSFLSYLLFPISLVYIFIQFVHRTYFRINTSSIYHCPVPVISIGNIVSGGTGKTPFTVFLVQYLTKAGKKVAVSHRDYKGKYENDNQFLSLREGILPEVLHAGDEAALLAEKLHEIPVIAGKNRKKSLMLLTAKYPDLDYIILDDSFQHLRVYHDFDFIMFQAKAGYGNGFVLPAGILREPLSVLKNADFIVWNGNEPVPVKLQSYNKPILKGNTNNCELKDILENKMPLEHLRDKKLVLISGIGYPRGFEDTIHSVGLNFIYHYSLTDHYDYRNRLFTRHLKREFQMHNFDYLVTTEKDYVKLRKARLNLPILIVEIEFVPEGESLQYLRILNT